MSRQRHLGPTQKIEVAFHYHFNDIPQHVLAAIYRVNQGRIAEALKCVNDAVGVGLYKTNRRITLSKF